MRYRHIRGGERRLRNRWILDRLEEAADPPRGIGSAALAERDRPQGRSAISQDSCEGYSVAAKVVVARVCVALACAAPLALMPTRLTRIRLLSLRPVRCDELALILI